MLSVIWELVQFQVPTGMLGLMYSILNFSWSEMLLCFDRTFKSQHPITILLESQPIINVLFGHDFFGYLQQYHMTFLTWVLLTQDRSWSSCSYSDFIPSLFFPLKNSVFSVFIDGDGSFSVPLMIRCLWIMLRQFVMQFAFTVCQVPS